MAAFPRRKTFILAGLCGFQRLLVLPPEVPGTVQQAENAKPHRVRDVVFGQRLGIPFEDRGSQGLSRIGKIPFRFVELAF